MSALWRINLLVTLFFTLVAAVCLAVLLRQASHDVQRELSAAAAVVEYLSEVAERDPAALQPSLTESLRHIRVRWLDAGQGAALDEDGSLNAWLGAWLYPVESVPNEVALPDGRRLLISVDPHDEIDEVWDSLLQLLTLFGLALLLSLLAIRWAVRPGMRVLQELLSALRQVSEGRLEVRLQPHSLPEARQLAGRFNHMAGALEQARAENGQLTQALLALQERERTQLAQALHDDLGQYLAGIRAQACLLKVVKDQPQLVASTAACLDDNCRHLQDGFRRLTRELYPVMLEHLELPQAIRQLGEQWQQAQGIECRLHLDERIPSLPLETKEHLYRLLQEALTNIARHAGASEVRVRLQCHGRRLSLLVRDNGPGLARPRRPGIGLRSMMERARCLGGEFRLSSRPGKGWAIYLNIPLVEATAA